MTIVPGTRLGPYEIVTSIGAGGMGEVYRARDTRLDREVAVKILPAELAQNAQFRIRFEREAKTISQLSHPNICTLFDVGENYLVMELLEGETLADRVNRGPLPLPDVLKYGTQIAEALGKAHRAGIVHRDLKPGNIMVTKSGAKLLDFGLAKSSAPALVPDGATVQKPLTAEGTILGTFQYMAPEQLAGEEPDARTDIFALGAVLYEMATGKRAFEGKTKTSLIGAIVSGEPKPMHDLQPLTPPALEHTVKKCLTKDPDDRWQSASDVAEELRWISDAGSQAGVAAPVAQKQRSRLRRWELTAAAGWLLFAVAAVTAVISIRRAIEGDRILQTEVSLPYGNPPLGNTLALSPDGTTLAWPISINTATFLYLRNLRTGEGRILDGTEGGEYPFWSPDSRSIGFFANGKLKTINVQTGAIQIVCDATDGRGGTWNQNGVILFAPGVFTPLFKVPASGGTPVVVTKLPAGQEWSHRNPFFLSDGEHFLFASMSGSDIGDTEMVGSLRKGAERKMFDYPTTVAYSDGRLFSVRNGTLLVQRFDAANATALGSPRAIANDVDWYGPRADAAIAAAGNVLVYHPATRPKMRILVADRTGKVEEEGEAATYDAGKLHASPDGGAVTVNRFESSRGEFDLMLEDFSGGASSRLMPSGSSGEIRAVFSPDGSSLLISDDESAIRELWIQPAGGGPRDVLLKGTEFVQASDWSHDGKIVVFAVQSGITGQFEIDYIRLDGNRRPVVFVQNLGNNGTARLSPDQHWLAFASDEEGKNNVYVTSFPSGQRKWRISTTGGAYPRWSPDGRTLYYLSRGRIQAVVVSEEPLFSVGQTHTLQAFGDGIRGFDVARNGKIIALQAPDQSPPPLKVVLNWPRMLENK